MNKVVVTGATSMIGTALIQYLISQGIEILAISRRMTKELYEFEKTGKCKVAICNLEGISELKVKDYATDYDAFFHLAWFGTFGELRQDDYMQARNIKYTLDCVKLAQDLGCKTFLGVGSQAEYGRVDDVIRYDTPTNPDTPYGISKLAAGRLSRHYAQSLGMKHIWVRIFSVYGPHDNPKTMVMTSISNFLEDKPTKYTGATQIWNYLYVKDAARGIFLACDKGKDGEVYCIANRRNHILKSYILHMRDEINPKAKVAFGEIPYIGGNPLGLNVDITREEVELGFIPEYSFGYGIKETVEWYKQQKK